MAHHLVSIWHFKYKCSDYFHMQVQSQTRRLVLVVRKSNVQLPKLVKLQRERESGVHPKGEKLR